MIFALVLALSPYAPRVTKSDTVAAPRHPLGGPLVRLCADSQRQLWGLRLGRLYGIGIGVSYALLAWLGPGSASTASKLWARCLMTASWVAGVGALSLATDLEARDALQGIVGLARLRGHDAAELEQARTLAGARALTRAVLIPGLIVALALMLRLHTPRAALASLTFALLTLPYAVVVGVTLAVLARACSRWLPGRGRLLLLAVTLGPWLLALGLGRDLPSIPGAFAWLLARLSRSPL